MNTRHITPYIVSVIVVAFLAVLAYIMFFAPKIEEGRALEAEAAQVSDVNKDLSVKVSLIKEKVADLDGLTKRINEFHDAFPTGASQQDLMDSIIEAGNTTGVEVTSINPAVPAPVVEEDAEPVAVIDPEAETLVNEETTDDPAEGETPGGESAAEQMPAPAPEPETPSVAIVGLTINAAGNEDGLRDFMQKLEKLDRPVTVNEFQINATDSGAKLTITGESFLVAPLEAPDTGAGNDAADQEGAAVNG